MRLIVYLDLGGVEKVEIEHATPEEREQTHRLYASLRVAIEQLDISVKKHAPKVAGCAGGRSDETR